MTANAPMPSLIGADPVIGLIIARCEGSVRVRLGQQSAELGLSALPHAVLRPLLMHVVDCTIDGAAAQFVASPRLVETLVGGVLPGVHVMDLSPQTRALALEAALTDGLDALETQLGAGITLNAVTDSRDPAIDLLTPNVGVRIALDGAAPVMLPAHIPEAVLRKLIALQLGVTVNDAQLDPEVPLAVRIGRTTSTQSEVASLTENDVLLLDETLLDDDRLCLIVDESYGVMGELDGKSLKLDGPLAPVEQSWLQRFTASAAADRGRRPQPSGNGSSNPPDPPTIVVVDLAYRLARLSELLRISASDPVALPQGIDGIVELRVGRRRIATGRLARVGAAVGVRIVRMEPNVRT
jgi:type III secretion protein Q